MHGPSPRLLISLLIAALLAPFVTVTADAKTTTVLPSGFLWGVASSGFQSEGSSPDSNWTRYIAEGKTADQIGTP